MKIIILQDYLRCGGTEKQSIFLVNYLNNSGQEASILTCRPGGSLINEVENNRTFSLQKYDSGIDWYAPKIFSLISSCNADILICMGSRY